MKKIAVVAAAVLLFAVCSSMVSAIQWNQVLSPGAGRMAVDPSGNLWLVTNSKLCKWVNNQWESEDLPASENRKQTNIIFGSDGQPHVIACEAGTYYSPSTMKYLSKTSSGWTEETITTTASSWLDKCSGTSDANGTPYVAYLANDSTYGGLALATRNSDGTWSSEPINIPNVMPCSPQVRIDPNGRFWVAYYAYAKDSAKVAYKWPGQAWDSLAVSPDDGARTIGMLQLEIDAQGRKTFAYCGKDAPYKLVCETTIGTLARIDVPIATYGSLFDLTLMGNGSRMVAYTWGDTSTIRGSLYCTWYKTLTSPVTFKLGNNDLFWYEMDAQAVGNKLFINADTSIGSQTWWATVPEPSSIMALFAGIAGLGLVRRRK